MSSKKESSTTEGVEARKITVAEGHISLTVVPEQIVTDEGSYEVVKFRVESGGVGGAFRLPVDKARELCRAIQSVIGAE
jgi:hypothetical protein